MEKLEMADFSKCQRTYCPCDECPHGIEKRDGSGDDSECKICEFANLQEALKLMAQDFYDSSDDEIHTGADSLADDYIQMAQAARKPEGSET